MKMETQDSRLIQVLLPDHSLLILTEAGFARTSRRGDVTLRNRRLKDHPLDPTDLIEAREVTDV